MTKRVVCLLAVLGGLPWAAQAQVRAGPEFRVNTYTASDQKYPSVASDASGNFVVVWSSSGQDGSRYGIFGQRFAAAGPPLGAEFQVNAWTTNRQYTPSVASDASGNFVVAWQSEGPDGEAYGIAGQRFSAAGAMLGAEFQVNTFTPYQQTYASVASDASGNFVVAWQSRYQDGSAFGVFGQRFSAAGTPLGAEFRVNTYTPSYQAEPSVASDASGNFVVAWGSNGQDGSGYGIFGQRFSAAGDPLGAEFRVNTFTTGRQSRSSVASDANGNFVVAWSSNGQDGSGWGVFGQRFGAAGTPLGAEFRVNTFTSSYQLGPSVASDASGNLVVAWMSFEQDGSSLGDVGQRFGGLHPTALAVDTVTTPNSDGNRVLEPGEVTDARPSWTNTNGAAQAIGGVFSDIAGPPGATYLVPDPAGDYGTVADGATQACLDCYGIAVSLPTVRPVVHWEASVLETITPDTHGQTQRWRLHIGDSFTDVPRTNPFYRFIETLLHNGVTTGCAGTQYCPALSTTREQMAVFVLVAKERPGHTPPACVPPNIFNDVAETSPFCRWVEELANRGVVTGCAPSLYCPTDAVTREQMAVFVLRTLDPALNPPNCVAGSERFADVPASSAFCKWIEELARRAVVTGCGGGNYCPGASVTREQMGVFISVTFGLLLYGP